MSQATRRMLAARATAKVRNRVRTRCFIRRSVFVRKPLVPGVLFISTDVLRRIGLDHNRVRELGYRRVAGKRRSRPLWAELTPHPTRDAFEVSGEVSQRLTCAP